MSFRVARHVFSTAVRSSAKPLRANTSGIQLGARGMSSSHAPTQSSDRSWIIASSLIFGPALLYLLSPSARKHTHHEHHDLHDLPGHHKTESAQEIEHVILKDDENTAADVTESVRQAVAEDVPKADAADPSTSTTESAVDKPAAETKDNIQSEKQGTTEVLEGSGDGEKKRGTFQDLGEEGPTDLGAPRQAAKEGILPKQKAEEQSSS